MREVVTAVVVRVLDGMHVLRVAVDVFHEHIAPRSMKSRQRDIHRRFGLHSVRFGLTAAISRYRFHRCLA